MWNNDHVTNFVTYNQSVILPIIYSALEKNMSGGHWNQAVHSLTLNARKKFLEMDVQVFEVCKLAYEEKEESEKVAQKRRELTWQHLDVIAAKNMPVVMVHF